MVLGIRRIVGSPDFGGTRPVWIVANDDREYLLKFRYDGMQKDISIFNETLARLFVDEFNLEINIPPLKYVELREDDIFLFEDARKCRLIDDESLKNAKSSIGINIGVFKIDHAQKACDGFTNKLVKNTAYIDNALLNKDRYTQNPNILYAKGERRHYIIDFGQALLEHRAYEAMLNGNYGNYALALQTCDILKDERYLLRKAMRKTPVKEQFKTIYSKILNIIEKLPEEWEPVKFKKEIAELLAHRVRANFKKSGECPFELFE